MNALFDCTVFIIMEQDTPSIAVRLRWGGMRFLEKTKIQHFLLTQTQVLMQGTPFVNNESISQGLRPVVHIANVVVLFYLSV